MRQLLHFMDCIFVRTGMGCIFVLLWGLPITGQTMREDFSRVRQRYTIAMQADSVVNLTTNAPQRSLYYSVKNHRLVDEPDQIIDLPSIDAAPSAWKYEYYQRLVVAAGFGGYPLVFGDWNQNGRLDVLGNYKQPQNSELAEVAIMELTPDSLFQLQQVYTDSLVTPIGTTDMDQDGRQELNIRRMQHFWNLESTQSGIYPDSVQFSHRMWNMSWAVGSETFTDLDCDPWIDLIYVGDDTSMWHGQGVFVAEYDTSVQTMVRRMANQPPEWRVSGIGTGDFDQDGAADFVIGSIFGDVYVYECTGDNTYVRVFDGTVGLSNAYMNQATHDLDGNGQPEFFIGASAYLGGQAGTLLTWFEATGDNQYAPVRDVLLLGTSVLGETELFIADLDGDEREELLCTFGGFFVILQWNPVAAQFEVFYLQRLEEGWVEISALTPYKPY